MGDHVIPTCEADHSRHFTQLVAVGPFAVLGLVLMACTARTCRITGITALYEEIGSEDMKAALQMLDEGVAGHEISALLDAAEEEEDLGEVVERK
jgi:ribonuclease MRP protein subunit RMP1